MSHHTKEETKKGSRNVLGPVALATWKSVLIQTATEVTGAIPKESETFMSLVKTEDFKELYSLAEKLASNSYASAAEHFAANQLAALVLKYPAPDNLFGFEETPEQYAQKKFLKSEEKCRVSNNRLRKYRLNDSGKCTRFAPLLEHMRGWIRDVLGSLKISEVYDSCSFGSGSNVGIHGNRTHLARKLSSSEWSCSPACRPIAMRALWHNPQLRCLILQDSMDDTDEIVGFDPEIFENKVNKRIKATSFNAISFVPKTAKSARTIAIEPTLNTFVQKGIDCVLRSKLRARGYDLTDQTKNQRLARIGSIGNQLVTLDLSSASDSMSTELVRTLFPEDWTWLMAMVRSPDYKLNGEVFHYHKFVSMGDGFCFPLQTLIFAAAVRASIWGSGCGEYEEHAVYGDDIIVHRNAFPLLKTLLAYLGFTVNQEKTHKDGPFRESCGADWYMGQDVRPVYLDFILSEATALRIFHNATYRGDRTEMVFTSIRESLRNMCPPRETFLRPLNRHKYRQPVRKGKTWTELQNLNGAFDVELDTFMSSRFARWCRETLRWMWKEVVYLTMDDPTTYPSACGYLLFLSGSPTGKGALRFTTEARVRWI